MKNYNKDGNYKLLDYEYVNYLSELIVGLLPTTIARSKLFYFDPFSLEDESPLFELDISKISTKIEYFRRIIDFRVISEIKTVRDRYIHLSKKSNIHKFSIFLEKNKGKKLKGQDSSSVENYQQSYFEGYVLLAYTLVHLACLKFTDLQEEIRTIISSETNKNRGKGSLDLKIERKIKQWKENYLFNIRNILQKYSRGLEVLSIDNRIAKLNNLLEGKYSIELNL